MSAEVLREAARLMRERAEAATPGPWWSYVEGRDDDGGGSSEILPDPHEGDMVLADDGVHVVDSAEFSVHVGSGYHRRWEADQDFIAAADPPFILAVAALLEAEADAYERAIEGAHNAARVAYRFAPALAVAASWDTRTSMQEFFAATSLGSDQ